MEKRNMVVGQFALMAVFFTALLSAPIQAATLPNFTQLVKNNKKVVVNISTTQTREVSGGESGPSGSGNPFQGLPKNSPFNEFFKHYFGEQQGMPHKQTLRSLGSGFIVSSDGYIITNAHVVDHADQIVVHLSDQSEMPAKLVGSDNRSDVALLKISAKNLPVAKLGNSGKLEVGQWVLAIGSPFGFNYSATQGIVSALQRSLPSDTYVPFIQTDVPLNPGNSGGPLFDTQGEVVGINSQIFSNTGGYMGLSFAIPIDLAMNVAEQLKTNGHVTRGWLGVAIQPVDQSLIQAFGLKKPEGALVAEVTPDSPAEKAGIKTGDVIVKYKHQTVEKSDQLPPMVASTSVGSAVEVTVIRDGKPVELKVTIGRLGKGHHGVLAQEDIPTLDVVVSNLNAKQREDLKIGDRGVLVSEVDQGPAEEAGIQQNDVILSVNHEDVNNVDQLDKLVKTLPQGKSVPVLIDRDDSPLFLALTLSGQ